MSWVDCYSLRPRILIMDTPKAWISAISRILQGTRPYEPQQQGSQWPRNTCEANNRAKPKMG